MRKISLFLILISTINSYAYSYKNNNDVRKANKLYNKEKFTEAEILYKKTLENKSGCFEANFNLGNSLYRQERYDEAQKFYEKSLQENKKEKKQEQAAVWHNIGNSLLVQNKIEESIEAYKNALRKKPDDDETRYNLAFAQYLRKKYKDKEKEEKNQENKKEEEEPKDNQDKQNPNIGISKLNAEQILKALLEDEKEIQLKIKRQVLKEADTIEKKW